MLLFDQQNSAVASDQAFVMYRLAAQAVNARTDETPLRDGTTHDLDAMLAAVREDTRVIFIANPNNPTGTYVNRYEMRAFFDRVPDHVLTVVDEAYKEYVVADDYPDATDYLRQGKNVMVLRTFSKIHGLAGFRVGYAVTTPEMVDGLDRVRSPFNTTSVGQVAALHALDDEEHVERSRALNNLEKEFLSRELKKRNLAFVPSAANFILVDVGMDSEQFFLKLLPRGVIVRSMKGYRFPNHIRLSIGLREENEKFLRALDQAMI
jgi:histidinol-phosphate aminotransferase